MPGAPLHAPQGPTGLLPTIFTSEHPSPEFFFCSSAHFHRGTARTRPCGGTFWNFPGSATLSSQNPSGGSLRQYFSVTSPYFLPGCFFSLLRFHHAMWRKSAPKSHIGLLRLHRCVPTQPSVPRMGGSWQEPDKLLHLLKLFCISNFASNFLTYHLACSHRILVKAALLL